MRESGRGLQKFFSGSVKALVASAEGSAVRLVATMAERFPAFRDESDFMGRTVCIMKRAQIFVADVWGCFAGQGIGAFADIDRITMFADYRVPQLLYSLGILGYSERLERHIRALLPLPHGAQEEVELRGCSVEAVQRLVARLQPHVPHVNAILVDFYLWDRAKQAQSAGDSIPCHRTRSIYY